MSLTRNPRGSDSSQRHDHLANVLPLKETEESAYRIVDSFRYCFLVPQFASSEIAPHFLFELGLAI